LFPHSSALLFHHPIHDLLTNDISQAVLHVKLCSIDNTSRLCYYEDMSKSQTNQQIQTLQTPSALDRFALSFEYDKTLQEIKQEVRQRTI